VDEFIVHTGQHYDYNMSHAFFSELGIPEPFINLGIGSASHGSQTGRMLEAVESTLKAIHHDLVLVYGDTNSTLAGALAASKINTPVAHVEAGLRCYKKSMPEEINRVVTDHISSLLFSPTSNAMENLRREGLIKGVYLVGDVMYDSVLHCKSLINKRKDVLKALNLVPHNYLLATVHRAENTDDPEKLRAIFDCFGTMAKQTPVAVAMHPRTRDCLKRLGMQMDSDILIMEPLPYLSMLQLEQNALAIVTDSGGVQKEAFFFGRPCMTLREETEWKETVKQGANTLCGADQERMLDWHTKLMQDKLESPVNDFPYGDGRAASRILNIILKHFN
jgi:UDP-N-acetylglucosamine 2-epimerase